MLHNCRGTKLHTSTKDPNETRRVITVNIETAKGTNLESNHARDDGTSSQHVTRSGRAGQGGENSGKKE